MSCTYIQNLANQIWVDISSPTDITAGAIAAQLTSDLYLGRLSTTLGPCYTYASGAIQPVLGNTEQSILAGIYMVTYWGRKASQAAGAGGVNMRLAAVDEGDTKIRFHSSAELIRNYSTLQKQAKDNLDEQVRNYFDLSLGSDVPRTVDYYNIE